MKRLSSGTLVSALLVTGLFLGAAPALGADTTPPTITVPEDITTEATSSSGAVVDYTVSATDNVDVDPPPEVVCDHDHPSGSTFPLGTTSVSCTATDTAGNEGHGKFNVVVTHKAGPVITVPQTITAEATAPAGAQVTYTTSAYDAVDGPATPTCTPASGSMFPLGTTSVLCTATDAHGNPGHDETFDVVVTHNAGPVITVPQTITAEATAPAGAQVTYTTSAYDAVDGPATPTCTPASGSMFGLGPTSVLCKATDAHGNTGQRSFNVVVVHTAGPVITLPPVITAEAIGPTGAKITYTPSAYDAVDGPAVPSCTPVSGSMFRLGTTRVSCSAADKSGHVGYGGVDVVIVDTTRPAMTVPRTITAEATGPTGAKVLYAASARDIVDGLVSPSCTPASGSTFKLGATDVSCTATDKAGNSGTGAFRVLVRDTTRPALKLPAAMIVAARGPQDAIVFYTAIAGDRVDGLFAPACTPPSGSLFKLGATLVRCTATDRSHNASRGSFTITIRATAPWLTNVRQTHDGWVSGNALPHYAKAGPPTGTTFTYTLNQPAQVTFAFAGTATGGQLPVTATLRHRSHAGKNALHFEGRITRARWLPPGTYTVKITAAANGHPSYVRILQFTIIR